MQVIPAADQLHDAVTELLLSLWDAEDDRHPESGHMYSTCARVWAAIHEYRQVTGSHGGAVSQGILQEAREVLEKEQEEEDICQDDGSV